MVVAMMCALVRMSIPGLPSGGERAAVFVGGMLLSRHPKGYRMVLPRGSRLATPYKEKRRPGLWTRLIRLYIPIFNPPTPPTLD